MAGLPRIQTLDHSLHWLDDLERAAQVNGIGAWPVGAVLEHLAQGIEMSMDGFPRRKGALFDRTAGRLALGVFAIAHNLHIADHGRGILTA